METATIVTGDGCRIAYRLEGPKRAPVLLLSNSLGTGLATWELQAARLATRFRLLRYDSRGHGGSEAPAGSYSLDRLGIDAIELLDALQIATVDFCGLSLGGMVGQWLGIHAPERLRRLILANTSSFMGPRETWDARIAQVERDGMAPLVGPSLERWFTPNFRVRAPGMMATLAAMLQATNPQGYAGCCAAIRDMDTRRTATLIRVPTLLIGGSRDPATPPSHTNALAAAIVGAEVTMLEAAHLSNVECPEAFTGALLAFLTGDRAAVDGREV